MDQLNQQKVRLILDHPSSLSEQLNETFDKIIFGKLSVLIREPRANLLLISSAISVVFLVEITFISWAIGILGYEFYFRSIDIPSFEVLLFLLWSLSDSGFYGVFITPFYLFSSEFLFPALAIFSLLAISTVFHFKYKFCFINTGMGTLADFEHFIVSGTVFQWIFGIATLTFANYFRIRKNWSERWSRCYDRMTEIQVLDQTSDKGRLEVLLFCKELIDTHMWGHSSFKRFFFEQVDSLSIHYTLDRELSYGVVIKELETEIYKLKNRIQEWQMTLDKIRLITRMNDEIIKHLNTMLSNIIDQNMEDIPLILESNLLILGHDLLDANENYRKITNTLQRTIKKAN